MSVTHSSGLARTVNIAVVKATFVISLIGCVVLGGLALLQVPSNASIGAVIFGLCLVVCSLCSYMYTRRLNATDAAVWRQLDHAAIFLLIAGTYTPFVIHIAGPLGIGLIYWTWGLALFGIVMRLSIRQGYQRLFVGLYLLIGWLFLTALQDILAYTALTPLLLLGAGAVSYTLGALLFAKDIGRWTDPVWHAFVLGGCYLHFLAVLVLAIDSSYS